MISIVDINISVTFPSLIKSLHEQQGSSNVFFGIEAFSYVFVFSKFLHTNSIQPTSLETQHNQGKETETWMVCLHNLCFHIQSVKALIQDGQTGKVTLCCKAPIVLVPSH